MTDEQAQQLINWIADTNRFLKGGIFTHSLTSAVAVGAFIGAGMAGIGLLILVSIFSAG